MIDGKTYVGQTVNSFKTRYNKSGHWWICTGNVWLKRAAEKHGHGNFEIEILEENVKTKEELNKLEIDYIKKLNCLAPNGYNFCSGGNRRDHTEEICDKISQAQRKGKPFRFKSPDGKIYEFPNLAKFCREHNLSRPLMLHVDQGKRRKHKGWTLPDTELSFVILVSPEGKEFKVREGEMRPFCREHNLYRTSIKKMIDGKYKQTKGWTVKNV